MSLMLELLRRSHTIFLIHMESRSRNESRRGFLKKQGKKLWVSCRAFCRDQDERPKGGVAMAFGFHGFQWSLVAEVPDIFRNSIIRHCKIGVFKSTQVFKIYFDVFYVYSLLGVRTLSCRPCMLSLVDLASWDGEERQRMIRTWKPGC